MVGRRICSQVMVPGEFLGDLEPGTPLNKGKAGCSILWEAPSTKEAPGENSRLHGPTPFWHESMLTRLCTREAALIWGFRNWKWEGERWEPNLKALLGWCKGFPKTSTLGMQLGPQRPRPGVLHQALRPRKESDAKIWVRK